MLRSLHKRKNSKIYVPSLLFQFRLLVAKNGDGFRSARLKFGYVFVAKLSRGVDSSFWGSSAVEFWFMILAAAVLLVHFPTSLESQFVIAYKQIQSKAFHIQVHFLTLLVLFFAGFER